MTARASARSACGSSLGGCQEIKPRDRPTPSKSLFALPALFWRRRRRADGLGRLPNLSAASSKDLNILCGSGTDPADWADIAPTGTFRRATRTTPQDRTRPTICHSSNDRCRCPVPTDTNEPVVRFRRIRSVAERPGQRRLTEPVADAWFRRQGLLFVPQNGHRSCLVRELGKIEGIDALRRTAGWRIKRQDGSH